MGDQNRAWNFPIQWSRSFGEEIRFRTEIITSRRGNEQRIAQRNNPRIGYDFESFLKFDDFREALQRLNDNQGQPTHFPHPQFATELTTTTEVDLSRTRAISFTIDDSGSMANDGKLGTMKSAMTTVLQTLKTKLQNGDLDRLDINVTKWGDTHEAQNYYDATPAQIDTLIAFIDGFAATGTATDFDEAAQGAVTFFNGTLATSLGRRIWVFISDGQPTSGTLSTALTTAADLIDKDSGNFSEGAGTEVDIHAINIQDSNTGSAAQIDNTNGDGVPVVDAVEPDALLDYVLAATDGQSFGIASNPGSIRVGDRIFLDDGANREMVTVARLNGNFVSSIESVDHAFDIGTTVRRGVSGYVNGESKLTAATSRVGLSQIDIDADPVDTWHPDYSAVPETFNSKEFFNLGNQWASDVRVEFMQPVIELDLQRADVDRIFPTPFTTRKTRLRFVLRSQDHIDRLVGLFYRSRGRQKSFYMTTRLDEIRPLSIVPGNTFTVLGQDFARRFSDNDMYRFIQIKTADLTLTLTTEIVQVTVDVAGNSVVTIADIFNDAIPAETIKPIQWVCLSRFESDTLSLEWITDGVAEATVNFRTLEDPA